MMDDARRDGRGGGETGESGREAGQAIGPAPADCAPLRGADGHARPLSEVEGDAIRHAIRLYAGNLSEAARRLEMGRSTLYRRLRVLGVGSD
ncbi:MAG: helix-turn-helix domain-containing protein [Pseudomonadota bacterium]|nr:helix-turn-helix domain-containing protein [Pseudomonadota bacterium]